LSIPIGLRRRRLHGA